VFLFWGVPNVSEKLVMGDSEWSLKKKTLGEKIECDDFNIDVF